MLILLCHYFVADCVPFSNLLQYHNVLEEILILLSWMELQDIGRAFEEGSHGGADTTTGLTKGSG